VITPAEVLRKQADLLGRLSNPGFAGGVETHLTSGMQPQGDGGARYDDSNTRDIARGFRYYLQQARAYRVEESMNDVVWDRANAFDNDAKMPQPPSQSGFVVFERPIAVVDTRGRTELIHVLTWGPIVVGLSVRGNPVRSNQGLYITTWNDTSREMDEVGTWMLETQSRADLEKYLLIAGPWMQSGSMAHGMDWSLGPPVVEIDDAYKEWVRSAGDEPMDGTINMNRFYAALFGMLAETIPGASRTPEYPERVARKQAKRAKIEPVVDLVKLRQVASQPPAHPGTGSPIGVQYYVKSFPRTIHRGTDRERVVMVRGHKRGPDDAPWSERSKVYDLSR
jgi:hypothetical protein